MNKFEKIIASFSNYKKPVSRFPEHVKIMEGSRISTDSQIGDFTYIGFNTCITKSIIGRYCSIADNVSIGSGEHDLHSISTSSLFYDDKYKVLTNNNCSIANDVWIGVDSIVRRGVHIGNGAIIGANSFINIDVPDFAIFAGNPGKLIRYRFDQSIIEIILESNWWYLDFDNAQQKIKKIYERISN